MGRRPHGTTASAAASAASAHYNDEDIRRQAYIQSLGMYFLTIFLSNRHIYFFCHKCVVTIDDYKI